MEGEMKLKNAQNIMLFLAVTQHGKLIKKKFFQEEIMNKYNGSSPSHKLLLEEQKVEGNQAAVFNFQYYHQLDFDYLQLIKN